MDGDDRLYAGVWAAAGAVWVVNGLTGLDAPAHTSSFYVMAAVFLLAHLLVLAGLIELLRREVVGGSRWGRGGLQLAMAGRCAFIAAEVTLLARGYEGDLVLLPIAAMSTAVGMLVAGIAVIRAGRWHGWRRFAPVIMGGYPFVFMFPVVAVTGERPDVAVALWGLTYLGIAAALGLRPGSVSGAATARFRPWCYQRSVKRSRP